jgi:D-3-phosphoglycerate dehydrogenase
VGGGARLITIAVWDNIGNVLLGVRLPGMADNPWRQRLTPDDPLALNAAPTFDDLFADYEVRLHEVKTLAELETVIRELDYLVVHKEQVTPEVLAKGQKLRLIQHLGLDHRGVPLETARAMGVRVCATPLSNYLAVAEHAWALLLNHYKQLREQRRQMEDRVYVERGWGATVPGVRLLQGQVLGLVGFGEIARPMARYAGAFGMQTIYWDRVRFAALEEEYGVTYADWEALIRRADVISVHVPITPQTVHLIGEREIGWMKPTAFLINTARGKLVDQAALAAALRSRRLGGAGLDVMEIEPLPPDDPLHELNEDTSANVTLTSHSAWQGPWTWVRDSLNIWNNMLADLRGEPLRFEVA